MMSIGVIVYMNTHGISAEVALAIGGIIGGALAQCYNVIQHQMSFYYGGMEKD